MKVIIAGSRTITVWPPVSNAIKDCGFKITEVVCGGAQGVDYIGAALAELHGIPVKMFLAEWLRFGKAAGHRRNAQMAEYADALIAVWDGQSPGTKNMVEEMAKRGKPIYLVKVDLNAKFPDPMDEIEAALRGD